MAELDHFESKEVEDALKGFFSKNPWDARVIHTIFQFRGRMKKNLNQCLKAWNEGKYAESGQSLGRFVGRYLYFEQTAEQFDFEEFGDFNDMIPDHDRKETTVSDPPRRDPLDKWREKAKFRKF